MDGTEGKLWQFEICDLREQLNTLFNKAKLRTKDTRPSEKIIEGEDLWRRELLNGFPVICACGDEIGASYYGLVHNRNRDADEVSLLIKFAAPISSVYIDGRDFLYACFQLWHRKGPGYVNQQKRVLIKLFGVAIKKYFEKAVASEQQDYRLAMCDLACQDPRVVRGHSKNRIAMGGRFGTVFCSAFFVKAPISAEQIIAVGPPKEMDFHRQVLLDDFIEGRVTLPMGSQRRRN